jgi:hypothetical protein
VRRWADARCSGLRLHYVSDDQAETKFVGEPRSNA